ncbi:MAG: antitoxin family protein [Nitrospirota bacterium]|nr:antitoxin family protein [Nitrospirota bacterium]
MAGTIRARIKGGLIEPLEQMDLQEGQEVMVTILTVPTMTDNEAFQRSAGQWKGTLDAEELIRNIYTDRVVLTRPIPAL